MVVVVVLVLYMDRYIGGKTRGRGGEEGGEKGEMVVGGGTQPSPETEGDRR